MTQSALRSRGISNSLKFAAFPERFGARTFDLCVILGLWSSYHLASHSLSFPSLKLFLWLALFKLVFIVITFHVLGKSPGEWLWGLKLDPRLRGIRERLLKRRLLKKAEPRRSRALAAAIVTGLVGPLTAAAFYKAMVENPAWLMAENLRLTANTPRADDVVVSPFFFVIGSWPKAFEGKPVLYQLPYEKGPPSRFAGHIVARLQAPQTLLTLEGPKTPQPARTRLEIAHCLRELVAPRCFSLREATLARPLREMMEKTGGHAFKLQWFVVDNAELKNDERPQGFYLSVEGPELAQERFVAITPSGTHQALILDRPSGGAGATAHTAFSEVVRSLRVFDELGSGRAWIDRTLGDVKLDEIKRIGDPLEAVARLAEVENLLLSKISVDPKTLDTYFHLGGVAVLLSERAAQNPNSDWGAVAKGLLESLWRYGRDVDPNDPRTELLKQYWDRLKKS